jgi:hypothetical protein
MVFIAFIGECSMNWMASTVGSPKNQHTPQGHELNVRADLGLMCKKEQHYAA